MSLADIYMESFDEQPKSIYEEFFQLKKTLNNFKYYSIEGDSDDKDFSKTKVYTPQEVYKRRYGVCLDIVGATAYMWKNVIKSTRVCKGLLQCLPNPKTGFWYALHSSFIVEDDDQQHVYMLQPHMAAKCAIVKYPDYDSAILACEQDIAISNAIGSMFERNVKQKSMFEMLKDKMLKHLNEAKPYITIYEPLDTDLYKGRPALREFCERVIKTYGSVDLTKVDPNREREQPKQII